MIKRVSIIVLLSVIGVSCKIGDPSTDLVDVSESLTAKSINQSQGVDREARVVAMSDRKLTHLAIPEAIRGAPYFIDFDIADDQGAIWTQADLDCPSCSPDERLRRQHAWDLHIDGDRISLNTNNVDDATLKTRQAMAATDYLVPVAGFDQGLKLDNIQFKPQTAKIQSKIDPRKLYDSRNGNVGVNNAWLIRTSSGKRIVYFQFIDYDIQGQWLLFHVRQQRLDQPNSQFEPAQKIYIKWSKEAQGQGKVQLSATGELYAYFDFDACFPEGVQSACFTGVGSDLSGNVVSTEPMRGWDFFYKTNIMAAGASLTKLNGGFWRDTYNDGIDVAALHLGEVSSRFGLSGGFNLPINNLWGFNTIAKFERKARDSKRYQQRALGYDGKNDFDLSLWYRVKPSPNGLTRIANQRIYIVETTEGEGLGVQFAQLDDQGRISKIDYKGLKVEGRRKFNIHFRQPSQTDPYQVRNIEVPADFDLSYFPMVSLQDEILDDDNNRLSDDEFSLLRFSVENACFAGGITAEINHHDGVSAQSADLLSQPTLPVLKRDLTTTIGTRGGLPSPTVINITARLFGKDLVTWQTGFCFYQPQGDGSSRRIPCGDGPNETWKNQLKCQ